jgi:alpha-ribazole phosphatase
MRLFLIRHGAVEQDQAGRCYGREDVALSRHGHYQARQLAQALTSQPLAAVWSSPLRRCVDTARPIARRHRLPVQTSRDLLEIDFGAFEGRTYAEIQTDFPELYNHWMAAPWRMAFPDGESFAAFRTRVEAFLASLRQKHRTDVVAVVTHGGVCQVALLDALGEPLSRLQAHYQHVGRLSVIARDDRNSAVEAENVAPRSPVDLNRRE